MALLLAGIPLVVLTFSLLAGRRWGESEVLGEVRSVRPPICTQNVSGEQCGDGVITIRRAGHDEEFRYDPAIGDELLSLNHPGTQVAMTVSCRNGRVIAVRTVV
ncbi:hypothetical protein Rhe02_34510 [Rhizocola hellebori]|uniref:Uncharacterized protein n=1 Tax=Rhizocola hellebori TaxID=1392758 RepID=A0A8J3Q7G1_9ACTN|nr:hypothetical protein Rhe02_34510 [Rhizocola hellebori]